jgi:hypothetical protein
MEQLAQLGPHKNEGLAYYNSSWKSITTESQGEGRCHFDVSSIDIQPERRVGSVSDDCRQGAHGGISLSSTQQQHQNERQVSRKAVVCLNQFCFTSNNFTDNTADPQDENLEVVFQVDAVARALSLSSVQGQVQPQQITHYTSMVANDIDGARLGREQDVGALIARWTTGDARTQAWRESCRSAEENQTPSVPIGPGDEPPIFGKNIEPQVPLLQELSMNMFKGTRGTPSTVVSFPGSLIILDFLVPEVKRDEGLTRLPQTEELYRLVYDGRWACRTDRLKDQSSTQAERLLHESLDQTEQQSPDARHKANGWACDSSDNL